MSEKPAHTFPSNCRSGRRETIAIPEICVPPQNEFSKARRASELFSQDQLYPRYEPSQNRRSSDNGGLLSAEWWQGEKPRKSSAFLSIERNGERSRRSSVLSIEIKTNDDTELNVADILKNWSDVTITTTLEKQLAVQQLDLIMRNLKWGVLDQAKRAKKLHVKCMWLFLVAIMFAVLAYEIVQRGIQYYYNPIITTFTLRTPGAIEFPQVYVCMASSANLTYLLQRPREFAQLNRFRESVVKTRRRRQIDELDADEARRYLHTHESLFDRFRRQINSDQNISDFDAYDFFHDAGYKVSETFLECSFRVNTQKKLDCNEIVEPILDVNYGLCYIVNLDGMKQTVAGAGLTLVINSHVDLYPNDHVNAPRSSGLYVSISKDYDPTNWLKTCVAPGYFTKIDITGTRIEMLNLEFGALIQPCIEESDGAGLMQIFNATYSRTTCQLDCMLQEFKRKCQCILVVDKKLLRDDIVQDIEFCTPNRSQSCVIPKVTHDKESMANIDNCRNKCHTPCSSWRYEMRTSSAPLHAPAFAKFGLSTNSIQKNLVRIDVSFPVIEYSELVQSPCVTIFRLIADIGGLANLWMGVSMLSIFWTAILIARYCLSRMIEKCH